MRVLLIWPTGMKGDDWMLFPLGLGYLRNAVPCDILDCSIENVDNEAIAERARGYDVVGITVWGFNTHNVRNIIDRIRARSSARIVVGGPSAGLVAADYALLGEAEEKFATLLAQFAAPTVEQVDAIPGLGVGTERAPEMPRVFSDNLDELGVIDYDALRLADYHRAGYKYWMYTLKDKFVTAPVMATRGCPYKCTFCAAPALQGTKLRKHSIEYVIDSIETLYFKHGVRQVSFLDDNLTLDARWAKKLCEAIIRFKHKHNIELSFSTSNGVRYKTLDLELLKLMRRAGWGEIVLAPESGSERTLIRMRKELDLDVVDEKVDLVHRAGLNAVAFFIVGYPGEMPDDLEQSRRYIMNSKFDRAIVNLFNPIPGTPIYDELLAAGEIKPKEIKINYRSAEALQYVTPGLTRDALRRFQLDVSEKTRFREMWLKDLPLAA
ncbi:MAG: B12-binding domain-containing radical SAM protein [Alphaproteobacteria bacterium]|nr:B12-binding domain-containing radical SAM protein [Alphaproteobacteria bacterium]MBU6471902.1 B12-binding domain-containing radical SAM protein [Alphaproteobacteria bacterium]MDE2073852.1 B12-binding domain-containing radical SAM protein [Alphaproteobacteria bacterium]MDE2351944.1 B12-binding domain-containing radical SAM protein [Alphaproteobacteria bacterium]